jgi:hypothetical protein
LVDPLRFTGRRGEREERERERGERREERDKERQQVTSPSTDEGRGILAAAQQG